MFISDMLTKAELLSRGWTDALIRCFMPAPDDTRPNPKFAKAARMKLYERQRVEKCEALLQFARKKQEAHLRKQSAKRAVETKRAKMQEYLDGLTIEIPFIENDELITRSQKHHYIIWIADDCLPPVERPCVNYIRHCETEYESCLARIAETTGRCDAYIEIKGKVVEAIAEKYDCLAEECEKQLKLSWKRHNEDVV